MDSLNIVFDLTRRPATPFTYLNTVAGLIEVSSSLGFRAHPIVLLSAETSPLESMLTRQGLSRALQVEGDRSEDAWKTTSDALAPGPTLVLARGTYVSGRWLRRALDLFERMKHDRVIIPEVGAFNRRGLVEYFSFARETFEKYQAPALRISEFTPVALGSSEKMAELLRLGVFSSEPFSREAWLQSWLRRDWLQVLAHSAFHMDASIVSLLHEGVFKHVQWSSVFPEPWLACELRELGAIDPRIHEATPSLAVTLIRPISSEMEAEIARLESQIPRGALALFVTGPMEQEHEFWIQQMLIESLAESGSGSICALVPGSEGETKKEIGQVTVRLIGIKQALWQFNGAVQARILASLIHAREPKRVHIFESHLAAELCAALSSSGVSSVTASATVLPRHDLKFVFDPKLLRPEHQKEVKGVKFALFSEDQILCKSLRAYGEVETESCSSWMPSEWRAQFFGPAPDDAAELAPSDAKIASALGSWISPGKEWDLLGRRHMLEGFGHCRDTISLPVPSGFLSLHQSPQDLPSSPVFVARDGVLPLSVFFERCKTPAGYCGKLLIAEALEPLVPEAWRHRVLFYRLRSTRLVQGDARRLILFGLAYEPASPLPLLEKGLERVKEALGSRVDSMQIDCYFPHVNRGWGCDENSSYASDFVLALRRRFPGKKLGWLNDPLFSSLQVDSTTVFHEVDSGLLSALSTSRWSLLSKGGVPLENPTRTQSRVPKVTIAASPWHLLEAYEPGEHVAVDGKASLMEYSGPLARTPAFIELLEKTQA